MRTFARFRAPVCRALCCRAPVWLLSLSLLAGAARAELITDPAHPALQGAAGEDFTTATKGDCPWLHN